MKLPNLKRGVEVVKEQKPFSGIRLRMPIPSKFDLGYHPPSLIHVPFCEYLLLARMIILHFFIASSILGLEKVISR